ncbi:hypothetical protein SEA_MOLIVIA_25 [Arthrobacter phage Molivia]|uniref:Uncharacterized protein n=1 Tax=Arthrobacter phage Molivia TaxID=2015839 RepID=A0A286N4E2_9CAUD|nr:hypothetical protein FDI28_gp89 [Arthrobacter phage Molivia]ASX99249.1 hypothetical protein SEA_MOLIVIA_25 [Arthrobacter phage Molivia]
MNKELLRVLDVMHQNDPGEPDWAAVQDIVFSSSNPRSLAMELLRIQYLYAEDPSAFDDFLAGLQEV